MGAPTDPATGRIVLQRTSSSGREVVPLHHRADGENLGICVEPSEEHGSGVMSTRLEPVRVPGIGRRDDYSDRTIGLSDELAVVEIRAT